MQNSRDIIYGLIGYPLHHSFSGKYFAGKFEREQLRRYRYELFPISSIGELPELIRSTPGLRGLNVTIPYKQEVLPYLDEVSPEAERIGAVNVIRINGEKLEGFNSDVYGFERSLLDFLQENHAPVGQLKALVLGTGGAYRAVRYTLEKLGIPCQPVSRTSSPGVLTYDQVDEQVISTNQLIINTTPLGTFPNVSGCPELPYEAVGSGHYLYDLVYNPPESRFLESGRKQGASTCNGLAMLHLQAEKAWEIWRHAAEFT